MVNLKKKKEKREIILRFFNTHHLYQLEDIKFLLKNYHKWQNTNI